MPNHLQHETSPYLLQHVSNPVDWYAWGQAALSKAQAEDKPIFLSIGYAACHWCHVMAHESFEDESIAGLLNAHFVSIKVDREERPDLDHIYMLAVQAIAGNGGWPMSVFLTPEGQPFYGGTYFPSVSRHGMPSFRDVLVHVAEAWENRRSELLTSAQQITAMIRRNNADEAKPNTEEAASEQTLASAVDILIADHDDTRGGWGKPFKFPQPMALEVLLRHHQATGEERSLQVAGRALEAMARGGIYDQLGGGFHRYAVDDRWLVPHFEKMLYDNAQLARVYLRAWQVTGNALFHSIVEETLDYVLREMTGPAGGFYSSQDADSDGVEGKFYLWTEAEIRGILGRQAQGFLDAYGVTPRGNYEGQTILSLQGDLSTREALAEARRTLGAAREQRVHPGRDDKVLTAWNGLMLAAFAEAAQVWQRDDYRQIAERNAAFLLSAMHSPEGRLLRTWRAGQAKLNGYLEDHAHLAEGLLALYQVTSDSRWLDAAITLAKTMLTHFAAEHGFYDTRDDHEPLIVRPRDTQDNAVPSGNAMATLVLVRLAHLTHDSQCIEVAQANLQAMQPLMAQYPLGFAQWLVARDEMAHMMRR